MKLFWFSSMSLMIGTLMISQADRPIHAADAALEVGVLAEADAQAGGERDALLSVLDALAPGGSAALSGAAPAHAAADPVAPLVGDHCGECKAQWDGGSGWGHLAQAVVDEYTWPQPASEGDGWHPETWAEGGCATMHPHDSTSCEECYCPIGCAFIPECIEACIENECPGGGNFVEDYQALADGVRSGQIDPHQFAASRMLFQVNESRQALQGFGCGGEVILHIPMPLGNQAVAGKESLP